MFVKEKPEKRKHSYSDHAWARHQKERGINDGFVREVLCLCRTFWLREGDANFAFAFAGFLQTVCGFRYTDLLVSLTCIKTVLRIKR